MSFTGRWVLNKARTSDQKRVLTLMGRPRWQQSIVKDADENMRILQFEEKQDGTKPVFKFDKDVHIYLQASMIRLVSKITGVDFHHVHYRHTFEMFPDVTQSQAWPDDEKRFGPCTSKTIWIQSKNMLQLRWYLAPGILKVTHTLSPDGQQMRVHLHMTRLRDRMTAEATKVYDRVPFTRQDLQYRNQHPLRQWEVPPPPVIK